MHLTLPNYRRVRAGLAVAVAATMLSLAPAVTVEASAASTTTSIECTAAQAALAQAQRQQRVAKVQVVKARKALAKAKKTRRAVKVRKAKAALVRANKVAATRTRAVATKTGGVGYACAAPTSAARAAAAGKSLSILAAADGLTPGAFDRAQLLAVLDRFLPGVAGALTEGQVNAILAGFDVFLNEGEVSATEALTILGAAFTPAQITELLDGEAAPALVTALVGHIRTQLGGLAGMALPASFDPAAVQDFLAGIFGNLDASQLGKLIALLTDITDGPTLGDTAALNGLLETLITGYGGVFTPEALDAMFAAVSGGAPSAAVLSNLLGGSLTETQIGSLLDGVSPEEAELAGAAVARIIAQVATGGGGNLAPVDLDSNELVDLFNDVSARLGTFLCDLLLLCG